MLFDDIDMMKRCEPHSGQAVVVCSCYVLDESACQMCNGGAFFAAALGSHGASHSPRCPCAFVFPDMGCRNKGPCMLINKVSVTTDASREKQQVIVHSVRTIVECLESFLSGSRLDPVVSEAEKLIIEDVIHRNMKYDIEGIPEWAKRAFAALLNATVSAAAGLKF